MKMPPKKRDCDRSTVDSELFLQAFEKPTQIYRYLAKRHVTNPLFLNRSLTYMNHRMSRTNKRRKNFKIDAMLKIKENKVRMEKASIFGDYITLKFIGFYDKKLFNNNNNNNNSNKNINDVPNGNGNVKSSSSTVCSSSTSTSFNIDDDEDDSISNSENNVNTQLLYNIRVETILLKVSLNKRKDSPSAVQQESMGIIEIPANPAEDAESEVKYPSIKVPTESFMPLSENQNKSFILFFKVELVPKIKLNEDDDEPLAKQFKPNLKYYGAELSIFDKHCRCVLVAGQYDVGLQEIQPTAKNSGQKKLINWETIPDSGAEDLYEKIKSPFDIFKNFQTLRLLFEWTNNLNEYCDENSTQEPKDNNINNNQNDKNIKRQLALEEENVKIVYSFMYNNNSRQQTEYSQVSICPWCSLNCRKLYALLKHLKSCHPRFNFTYVPMHGDAARIDVTINDMYDGSYAGSPYDLIGPSSVARRHGTTVRRTVVTNLLVCRPRRQKANLSEFLELDENEINNQRPYITGHNRLYHHTETCLPVHPKELDYDSESEHDPLWLRYKTMQMIDEFTDVNEGEKELMKMWNLHIMKHGYVGDCQLPIACDMFLESKGHELIKKNLYRNFVLHMCSLFDYALVSPECVYKTIQKLQEMLSTYQEGQQLISDSRGKQLNFWLTYGMQKQAFKEQQQKEEENIKLPIVIETKALVNTNENQQITTKKLELKLEKLKTLVATTELSKNLNKKISETINLQLNKRKLRVSEKSLTRRRRSDTPITTDNIQKNLNTLKSRRRSVAVLNTSKIINDKTTASTNLAGKNNKK